MNAQFLDAFRVCKKRAYLQSLPLKDGAFVNKNLKEAKVIEQAIPISRAAGNTDGLYAFLEESLPLEVYISEGERRTRISHLGFHISRYLKYESSAQKEILKGSGFHSLSFEGKEVRISYSVLFKNGDGSVEIVRYKKGAPQLSNKARKPENLPSKDMGLYLLYKTAKQMHPESVVWAAYYHLQGKSDKPDSNAALFEETAGQNIVRISFSDEEAAEMERGIRESVLLDLSLSAEETKNPSDCRECYVERLCSLTRERQIPLRTLEERKDAPNAPILTENQVRAIKFKEGNCRVNAGAGTGKTTVIALRMLELLRDGNTDPAKILLITFTRKGAEEIRDRVSYWLSKEKSVVDPKKLNIHTFNSLGMDILNNAHQVLGFTRKPSVISRVEQYDLIISLLDNTPIEGFNMKNPLLNLPNAKGAVVKVAECFNLIKINGITSSEELSQKIKVSEDNAKKLLLLYEEYEGALRKMNLIEYHDQIKLATQILAKSPSSRKLYTFEHVMVDEYQDTDPSQVLFLKVLLDPKEKKSLVVVGDDSQAIYRFRLADQNNILKFHEEFRGTDDVFLVENFRSTKKILNSANLLNEINVHKIKKDLRSGRSEDGGIPSLLICRDKEEEYREALSIISTLMSTKGKSPSQFAVIARTGDELHSIKKVLEGGGIPCQLQTPVRLLDCPPIIGAMALAKVMADPSNSSALAQFVFSKATNKQLTALKEMGAQSLKVFLDEELLALQIPKEGASLVSFYEKAFMAFEESKHTQDFLTEISKRSFSNLSELSRFFMKMEEYQDNTYLDREDTLYDAVNLITAHSSKGKEYDTVIVLLDKFDGMVDKESEEELEEERRLLFVSITRAKNNLHLLVQAKGSRFAEELQGVEKTKAV